MPANCPADHTRQARLSQIPPLSPSGPSALAPLRTGERRQTTALPSRGGGHRTPRPPLMADYRGAADRDRERNRRNGEDHPGHSAVEQQSQQRRRNRSAEIEAGIDKAEHFPRSP